MAAPYTRTPYLPTCREHRGYLPTCREHHGYLPTCREHHGYLPICREHREEPTPAPATYRPAVSTMKNLHTHPLPTGLP